MILVTGANGMVGSYIDWDSTIKTDKDTLDVTNSKDIKKYKNADYLTAIVHLAAETDLEYCEESVQDAFRVNTVGAFNMLQLAQELDIPFVYISTAGIFDGKKHTSYTEDDIPNPLNMYGTSKWCGDIIVSKYPKHYIFRASWMMGGGPEKDKKFVAKIIDKVRRGHSLIYGIGDIYGSPTYAYDLTKSIRLALALKIPYGTYNCAGSGFASRFDVAEAIITIMGYKARVMRVSSDFFATQDGDHPCPRSHNEMLNMSKIEKIGLPMRHWTEAFDFFSTQDGDHPCPRSHNEMLDMMKISRAGLPMRPWIEALEDYLKEWK